MPHINLLPWREELRKQRQKEFGLMAGIAALLVGGVVLLAHMQVAAKIEYQNSRNAYLDKEISILDKKIEEIRDLEREKENLIARMKIVEQLQTSRPEIVHLFDEIVATLPEGVYLDSLTQKGRVVRLTGVAQSNARVSSFMRQLENSAWLENPDLKLIKAAGESKSTGLKISRFELTIKQSMAKKATDATDGSES